MSAEVPSIRMVLTANDLPETQVYQDQPLTLTVTITNHSAMASTSKNMPLVHRKRELDRKMADNQITPEQHNRAVEELQSKMKSSKVCRIGGPDGWANVIRFQMLEKNEWRDIDWQLVLMTQLPQGRVAEVGSKLCLAEFGLDTADRVERPYGRFRLQAKVEIAKDTHVQSNEVHVSLLQKPLPQAERKKEATILEIGRYCYKRGLLEEAKTRAEEGLQLDPNSLGALVLLGDVLLKQEKLGEALHTYEKALDRSESMGLEEPPNYIMMQLTKIRSMIGQEESETS